jgi:hypothetical protein
MLNYRFIEQKMKEKRITYRKMSELLGFKVQAHAGNGYMEEHR